MLEPADPWLDPRSLDGKIENFRGNTDYDISVNHVQDRDSSATTDSGTCDPVTVMASFYGWRTGVGPLSPMYIGFSEDEALCAGGILTQTDTKPPWPLEYSKSHHDISGDRDSVARYIASRHQEKGRVVEVGRSELLLGIAMLAERPDVEQGFIERSKKRFRRLFKNERQLWERIAERHSILRNFSAVELRKEAARDQSSGKKGKRGKGRRKNQDR